MSCIITVEKGNRINHYLKRLSLIVESLEAVHYVKSRILPNSLFNECIFCIPRAHHIFILKLKPTFH